MGYHVVRFRSDEDYEPVLTDGLVLGHYLPVFKLKPNF